MTERLFLIGAGAGAGEKNTRSRSKTDRLRNTGCVLYAVMLLQSSLGRELDDLVAEVESHIDPFDLSVFLPHLETRVKRACARSVIVYAMHVY